MPAPAVIPALLAYTNAVAVKKLVVGSRRLVGGAALAVATVGDAYNVSFAVVGLNRPTAATGEFTLNKSECSKQAFRLYAFAWNNGIGLWFYFVGFRNTK